MIIGIKEENLKNIKLCINCGKKPKLITKFFDDMSISKEISCQSENNECSIFNYEKINNDNLDEAIDKWNEKN